jgi:hypothetical protein
VRKQAIALSQLRVPQSAVSNFLMRTLSYAISLCGLLFLITGCNKEENTPPAVEARSSPSPIISPTTAKPQDVCSLLTRDEIKAVQGSAIRDATASVRADGGLRVAQCFYTAQDYSKSVVLTTTQTDFTQQNPKRNLKQLWDKTFHREFKTKEGEEEVEEKEKHGLEEEREGPPPKKIDGLGEEAFWSNGSLYVFTKDSFIRIAIGGPETEEIKIARLKTLAENAIPRL